uniref:Uncharacterized protein LOC116958016 n=1 Tax=Petromyzon marinus TaxID=7757 RepID=A0AAJ7XIW4_PETMA|nr:uncharacterized protein LOC116958016 [Petromyzon marinus]
MHQWRSILVLGGMILVVCYALQELSAGDSILRGCSLQVCYALQELSAGDSILRGCSLQVCYALQELSAGDSILRGCSLQVCYALQELSAGDSILRGCSLQVCYALQELSAGDSILRGCSLQVCYALQELSAGDSILRGCSLQVCYALQELSAATDCGNGFYKSPQGVCCELCRAGMHKVADCIGDGMGALCEPCPRGRFMDRDSQEEVCSQCSSCGPGEEVAVNCSVAQDTVCRCTEGLQRDGDSGFCLPEDPRSDAIVVALATILGFVLTGLLLYILCLKMKLKGSTFKKMLKRPDTTHTNNEHDENLPLVHIMRNEHKVPYGVQRSNESSETMQQIRVNKENLKAWLGADPSAFLEHLNGFKLIPRHVHQAAVDKGGEESVELVLDHFISQGEARCETLWDALYSVRKQYVQLWKWIQSHGEALRAIRDKESDLKLWIARDPKHLLLQLMSRGRIPNELFTEAKGIRDGAECAELLLNFFKERGNDDCLKLLFALQAVQNEYPGVKEWLGGLDFLRRLSNKSPLVLNKYSDFVLRDKIRFKTRELLRALHDDLTPLLSQLQIRNILTDNSVRAVKEMQARQGSEKATQHMVELVMARGRPRVKQFWEALWDLRESYPDLENVFEKF